MDRAQVARILTGKRVLITGAGGSIGSELARVAASFDPEQLILMDRSENALFEIDRQMGRKFPRIPRRAMLHDVVDVSGTLARVRDTRPHAVFHAAAHKHVPLMEDHPGHAVSNNLFGTKSIVDAAIDAGAERMVMISTDKAVNPTSVMGATKRLAEVYVRWQGSRSPQTELSMVRFGNVLGSACSVLSIWSMQLAEGGPITVTDPRMTRYFMTIPEAATLVIQAAALPTSHTSAAPVHVLDMGRPIPILDLAIRFINAHSLRARVHAETAADPRFVRDRLADLARREPDLTWEEPRDTAPPHTPAPRGSIDLVFTGARPGEKIHEELAYAAEKLAPTAHPGISAWAGTGDDANDALPEPSSVPRMIDDLDAARHAPDAASVLAALRRHVPEMSR
jgi:O-antigen biosynthesis protein WbqV